MTEITELRRLAAAAAVDYLDAVVESGTPPMVAISLLMAEIQQLAGGQDAA